MQTKQTRKVQTKRAAFLAAIRRRGGQTESLSRLATMDLGWPYGTAHYYMKALESDGLIDVERRGSGCPLTIGLAGVPDGS